MKLSLPQGNNETKAIPLSIFVIIWLLLHFIQGTHQLSYTCNGNWINKGDPSLCIENHVCTPSGKSFDLPFVKSDEMCSFLVSNNIKHINFYGDSYMRHIYIATSLFLTNNFKNATLSNEDIHCNYGNQFSLDTICKSNILPTVVTCNGNVYLSLQFMQEPMYKTCGKGNITLWSEGNHPVNLDYKTRKGVNDPVEYQKKYAGSNHLCPTLASGLNSCSLFWISTHYRHNKHYADESDDKVRFFNQQMRKWFEAGKCGSGTGYIDVYNMTSSLKADVPGELNFMSFDSAHWGMTVNLVKVQIIMTALKTFGIKF